MCTVFLTRWQSIEPAASQLLRFPKRLPARGDRDRRHDTVQERNAWGWRLLLCVAEARPGPRCGELNTLQALPSGIALGPESVARREDYDGRSLRDARQDVYRETSPARAGGGARRGEAPDRQASETGDVAEACTATEAVSQLPCHGDLGRAVRHGIVVVLVLGLGRALQDGEDAFRQSSPCAIWRWEDLGSHLRVCGGSRSTANHMVDRQAYLIRRGACQAGGGTEVALSGVHVRRNARLLDDELPQLYHLRPQSAHGVVCEFL